MVDPRWNQEYLEGAHWEKGPSPRLVEFAETLEPGLRILDAGCGSGRDSLHLARSGFVVSGVDISTVGIEKAKSAAADENLTIQFSIGQLESLMEFSDNEFDAVYCGFVLENTKIKKSIPELARVLRPNGVGLLVSLYDTKYSPPNEYDKTLDIQLLDQLVANSFSVTKRATEKYEESDQHGPHIHKRVAYWVRREK